MRPSEITPAVMEKIGGVLKIAAAYDQRTVGKADITAWALAVGQYPEDALMEAVVAFYVERATDDRTGRRPFIMPGDVVKRVRSAREDRLARAVPPAPESGDVGEYRADLTRMIRMVADGITMPGTRPRQALPYGGPPPKAIAAPKQPADTAGRTADVEEKYRAARGVLAKRRDLGEALLTLARERLGADADLAALIMRAAELAAAHPEFPIEHKEAS